uniref:Uncharacterized protein n=1 Tax=Anopheles dirus TaxID=7168 RepID=A0A182N9F0_9DIPT
MTFRNTACVFWCLVGLILAQQPRLPVHADDDDSLGQFMELGWNEHGSISPEELCRSLCGECQCRGQLVSENVCQCSCDFPPDHAGEEQNCTMKVQRLCNQMDVQCDFNGPTEDAHVRSPRGCHSMSCYEKHHGHGEGDYGGYQNDDGYEGYDEGYGHGPKELICCKDKKHKEKKHKHKKHKKFHDKHMKFHVVIKGKIPEPCCHGGCGGEGGEHSGGYEEHEGYRSAAPKGHPMNAGHAPMDVSVWSNRHKSAKKHPFRRPTHQHQQHQHPPAHYAGPPAYSAPYPESRGKSAEPPSPEVMPEPQDTHPQPPPPPPPPEEAPQAPAPPPPAEPESPPVTPFPEHPLTPPPNLFDGAPVGPKKPSPEQREPSRPHSFPPPPPMITVDPPPKRMETSRSYSEPSCEVDSYDLDFYHPPPSYREPPPPPTYHSPPPPTYHSPPPVYHEPPPAYYPPPPTYHPPPPTYHAPPPTYHKPPPAYHPPTPSFRSSHYEPPPTHYAPPPPPPKTSYLSSSYDPSYPSSHYHPHRDEYESPKHYSAYEKPVDYSAHDDSYYGDSYGGADHTYRHGVHAFSDRDVEDWPDFPPRDPADILTYNQIVSRQIIEADRARRYMDKPFQPTPRPLRDEFEPPTAEVGPVLYDSFGPPDKNYELYPVPTPPPDAYIPPEPPARDPVDFPEPENAPAMFSSNSEEALYPQPTPPPHYLRMKEAGSYSSFGFEQQHRRPAHWGDRYDGGSSSYRHFGSESHHRYRGASQGRPSSRRSLVSTFSSGYLPLPQRPEKSSISIDQTMIPPKPSSFSHSI